MLTGKYGKIFISQWLTKVFPAQKKNIAPWITKDLIKLSRKKKHLYKKGQKIQQRGSLGHLLYFEHFEKEM